MITSPATKNTQCLKPNWNDSWHRTSWGCRLHRKLRVPSPQRGDHLQRSPIHAPGPRQLRRPDADLGDLLLRHAGLGEPNEARFGDSTDFFRWTWPFRGIDMGTKLNQEFMGWTWVYSYVRWCKMTPNGLWMGLLIIEFTVYNIIIWLVVSNMNFIFHDIWDDLSHWRTPSFFRGVGQPARS